MTRVVLVNPRPVLWRRRQHPIRFVEIHATRGRGRTKAEEFAGTCGWMENPSNTGASCSEIIGDGELGIVLEDNQMPTWCAGFGDIGSTYAIDEYGVALEFCQSAALEDFTEKQYDLGAQRTALRCKAYGIPPVFITIPRQVGEPPAGIVRHDRCENGYKLGKSDPGDKFDEARFLARVKHYLGAEDEMTPEQEAELKKLREDFNTISGQIFPELKQLRTDVNTLSAQIGNLSGATVADVIADIQRRLKE
jgi:hypothetical protein